MEPRRPRTSSSRCRTCPTFPILSSRCRLWSCIPPCAGGLMVENITSAAGRLLRGQERKRRVDPSVEKGSRRKKRDSCGRCHRARQPAGRAHDTSDFSHALRSSSNGTVTVGIIPKKRTDDHSCRCRIAGTPATCSRRASMSRGRLHRNANEPEPSARGARAGSGRKCNMPCRNRARARRKKSGPKSSAPARSPGEVGARGP